MQPLFPGESGVDQLVEIIKVIMWDLTMLKNKKYNCLNFLLIL